MYTVSPEDRMRLVTQQHDEWRRQAAIDHVSASVSTRHEPSELHEPASHRLQPVRHLLYLLAHGHRETPRGMAH